MKHTSLLSLILLSLVTSNLSAQKFDRSALDGFLDTLAAHDQAMGVVSFFQGDEEVYRYAIGYADPTQTRLTTSDDVFRVASITKTFTTVIIHRLVEAGELSLSDKLAKYYPGLPGADTITLDQMLRHQSGLHNYTEDADIMDWIGTDQTPEQLIARIKAQPLNFEPGTDAAYSNSNFLLLGYIATTVSGKDYRQLLRDHVLEPAGLKNTYVGGSIDAERGEVVSFEWLDDGWVAVPEWSIPNAGAAGAISSTAADLNTFYRKLLRGELLPAATVAEMMEFKNELGQGLLTFPFYDKVAYGHNGGIEGFETLAAHFPNDDVTFTFLSNGVNLPNNDVMIGLLSLYFGKPYEMPDFSPVADLPRAATQVYVGTYGADTFPMDIKVFQEDGRLKAQASGQGSFPLTTAGGHVFRNQAAGIELLFDPVVGTLLLRQAGQEFMLKRE
ncbi:serine hydrolase domain-containing protein [Neolewinella antarctica]|uniref:CubicO group peptidase (Beta-lactamase class C family) n=1 Tax=Neolewinella antarctica TaxID=442734 RepID=A0ABX0X9W4_9BACT|nr:serine hydrolase domain-containing protein [Neolewinella antarctica]NJC25987.1 CubicO group peptidase (beta-lactamase class C family) [Neolewinella antarctica]